MHIDITTYIGDAEITISCYVQDGSCERVTAYVKGRRQPKLQRYAEDYVQSVDGSWKLADACADYRGF